jgi:hypothetical protein
MTVMKNLLFLIGFMGLALSAHSQFQVGIKGNYATTGATVNGIADFLPSPNHIDNYSVGIFGQYSLGNGFSFQPELLLSQKGFSVREDFDVNIFDFDVPLGIEARTKIKYVEMPLLAKYTFGENVGFYLEGGPSLGYAVDADIEERAHLLIDFNIGQQDIDLSKDLYNRWEVAGLVGAGVTIPAGAASIDLGMRYQHSITDMLDNPIIDVRLRNYGLSFGAGIKFNI